MASPLKKEKTAPYMSRSTMFAFTPQGRAHRAFAGAVTALFTAFLSPLLFFLQLEIILETMRFCQPLFRANLTKRTFHFGLLADSLHDVVKFTVSICESFDNLTKINFLPLFACFFLPSLV